MIVVNKKVRNIIDMNQYEVYADKLDVIHGILERSNSRLEKTGLPDIYKDDFIKSALNLLKSTYYSSDNSSIKPIIINYKTNKTLMSPDTAVSKTEIVSKWLQKDIVASTEQHSYSIIIDNKWYIYKYFDQWNWIIIYSMPLDIKYEEANHLINNIMIINVIAMTIATTVILLLLRRLLKPVFELTKATSEISSGNLQLKINTHGNDEFGTLAKSFESMRESIINKIKEISDNEENLHITLNSIGDAVVATNTEHNITRINKIASELTEWSAEEAINQPVTKILNIVDEDNKQMIDNVIKDITETGKISSRISNATLISKSGKKYQIADSASPIISKEGKLTGVVMVFRDITKEKSLQEQLNHQQRMDAIGQLAGGVAHDFNNMLGGIIGATELLKSYLPEDDKALNYHSMIISTAERAAKLTRQLLAFARKQNLISSSIDVHQCVNESVFLLQRTIDRRIKLNVSLEAKYSMVAGDPSQLQSAFLNLGINASQAMPEGGSISISSKEIYLNKSYCESSRYNLIPGNYIEIIFQDTGSGIDPENLKKIFEPFFTTKGIGKGTGLGLSAVLGTVEQHKGAINVYSELHKGTQFHILLPLKDGSTKVIEQDKKPLLKGKGHILVIDDEEVMRTTVQAILEDLGYDVTVSENGLSAIETVKRFPHKFNLILLDMIMPEMNGKDCFKHLLEINDKLKIILASGFSKNDDVEHMTEQGLKGFINKPYRSVELSEIVHKVLYEEKED